LSTRPCRPASCKIWLVQHGWIGALAACSAPQAVAPGRAWAWAQVGGSSDCPQQTDQGGGRRAADRLGAQAAGAVQPLSYVGSAQPRHLIFVSVTATIIVCMSLKLWASNSLPVLIS
jgi:hypothetical protein